MYAPEIFNRQSEVKAAIAYVEQKLAQDVVHIRYEIARDWSGQWAIFFRVLLTDDAARRRLRDVATEVVWRLADRLDFQSLGVFPYHNFRSASEQDALKEEAWA